ncbi:FtsW/RodA/SpoVE family cell cycle protein [Priestia sp. YIM B13446]|jgi:cell division protein FtsW|uniref:FtsW/RodA/SpoVE family cell cycle protein n=1 Tax=Priestia TaxID=2800373 RepID=UPI000491E993|nr:FtsW/RodA/SpoVE family cell cycle protein [Priestia megaterium]RCX28562.1 cell division-specific peptidoglycan biosynthesis regulator FtsW [Bacillus sp. AG236]KWU53445.1 cell division protein FtsW [Priestia megaterium]MCP1451037.1 cell division protein FtsW [Priestia megaterium]MCU7739628.1 FtsW/RodA/SpoVE family cell cycle protein [Priestia megaterium]MCU7745010.1 FtsW/RodA/SpoVE family cell cycle protein [Priestia megaterium]
MFKKILKCYDYKFIAALIVLSLIGLIMVYSASMVTAISRYGVSGDYFYKKQKLALIAGFILFTLAAIVPYKIYQEKAVLKFLLGVAISLLILVLAFGHTAGNAQSWFKIGPIAIQPLEITKLTLIIYLAAVFANKQEYINDLKRSILPPMVVVLFICFLIILQPDYGGALLILGTVAAIVLCSGISKKSILKISLLGLIGTLVMLAVLLVTGNMDLLFSPGRLARFTGFLHPFENQQGDGYQLVNSYVAIGNGGILGMGLGQGIQKTGYLPESHTDFIMAIIAEELGFWGVLLVLGLLFFIIFKGLKTAIKCRDPFGALLAIGISVMIAVQVFVNLGAVTGLLPITGVTLPFISFGGSSLTLLMLAAGILTNVSMFNTYTQTFKSHSMEQAYIRSV